MDRPNQHKLTQEYVESVFKDANCELLDTYINSEIPLKYKCSCGNISYIKLYNISHGQRCKKCGLKRRHNNGKRLTYEYVNQFFAQNNCTLLSKEYINAKTPLEYKCSCGRISQIVFDSFQNGNRCKQCGIKKAAKKQMFDINYIEKFLKKTFQCTLNRDTYRKAYSKFSFACDICGNIHNKTYYELKIWSGCFHNKEKDNVPRGSNCYQWREERDQVYLEYLFKQRCYKMVKNVLKCINQQKTKRTNQILGYSPYDLMQHITKHPNWDDLSKDDWHIDHIYPIKAFIEYGITDLKIVNCLENLQPLSASENCRKCDNYDPDAFEQWLIAHGHQKYVKSE